MGHAVVVTNLVLNLQVLKTFLFSIVKQIVCPNKLPLHYLLPEEQATRNSKPLKPAVGEVPSPCPQLALCNLFSYLLALTPFSCQTLMMLSFLIFAIIKINFPEKIFLFLSFFMWDMSHENKTECFFLNIVNKTLGILSNL